MQILKSNTALQVAGSAGFPLSEPLACPQLHFLRLLHHWVASPSKMSLPALTEPNTDDSKADSLDTNSINNTQRL